jgi:type II secretory pathway pseudopilin PulG
MSAMRARRGFALLWAIIGIAVLAAVGAAAAPYLVNVNDVDRVVATSKLLAQVTTGVDSFTLLVKRGGASWTTPNRLSLLTNTIVDATPAGCTTQTYNPTAVTAWATGAPYVSINMPTNGLWTPIGRLSDFPSRTAATIGTVRTGTSDPYFIQILGVDLQLAQMLDLTVDGVANAAAGIVWYSATAADGTVTVSYDTGLAHDPAC